MHEIVRRTFSPRGRVLILAVVLSVVTIFAYRPAWHGGFLWDDDAYIINHELLTALVPMDPTAMVARRLSSPDKPINCREAQTPLCCVPWQRPTQRIANLKKRLERPGLQCN